MKSIELFEHEHLKNQPIKSKGNKGRTSTLDKVYGFFVVDSKAKKYKYKFVQSVQLKNRGKLTFLCLERHMKFFRIILANLILNQAQMKI